MNVLSIAVHPDDETLGCGGTLLGHASAGDELHWLLVTAAHEPDYSPALLTQQANQVLLVEKAYPFDSLNWLKLPTSKLESIPLDTLINSIRQFVERVRPEVVFVPNRSDAHSDHRIVSLAALAVLKPYYMRSLGVQRVLACEVPSETDATAPLVENVFVPNVFVDVSKTLQRKLEIMSLYQTELHSDPLPRGLSAIQALARHRGATVGVEYAEAFMLIREVVG